MGRNYKGLSSFRSDISRNFRYFFNVRYKELVFWWICALFSEPMILDGLPLELMREVLLDLPTVDIIQTVKCIRRLYHFTKADKALGRRLQNRVSTFRLYLGNDKFCGICGKSVRIK